MENKVNIWHGLYAALKADDQRNRFKVYTIFGVNSSTSRKTVCLIKNSRTLNGGMKKYYLEDNPDKYNFYIYGVPCNIKKLYIYDKVKGYYVANPEYINLINNCVVNYLAYLSSLIIEILEENNTKYTKGRKTIGIDTLEKYFGIDKETLTCVLKYSNRLSYCEKNSHLIKLVK